MQVVDRDLLEAIASMRPSPPSEGVWGAAPRDGRRAFDVGLWLTEHGINTVKEGEWLGGYRWVLEECPWNGHADKSAYVVRFSSGAISAGCHHASCQGQGWRELREHYEPGVYDVGELDSDTGDEREPNPSRSPRSAVALPPAPVFPVEVLPPTIRRIVEEASASIDCPPEFLAVPILPVLAAAVGNAYKLRIKKGWTEGAALYAAVIADPGEKKTPASKVATRPAWKRQADLRRKYEREGQEYLSEKRQWDVDKKAAQNEGRPAPPPPEEPIMGRTVVEDTTVEALVDRLKDNPRGLLCSRDELSGWVRAMDQYKGGRGSDRQFWLSVWSNSPVSVDRKSGTAPVMVPIPFMSLTGSIQPETLAELKNAREDGLLDRFLFSYPEPVSSRYNDNEISDEATEAYQKLYDRLYDLEMGVDDNGDPAPKRLDFTDEAKKVWRMEANSIREEMDHPRFPKHLRGPWSKLEAYLARLALILALVRVREPESVSSRVLALTESDVKAAAELIRYFKAHARRVYAKLYGERPENLLLLALDRFLAEQGGAWEGMTSELYKILNDRSAPGLPGGEVPLGKWLRKLTEQDGITLEEGWDDKKPIVKLSRATSDPPEEAMDFTLSGSSGGEIITPGIAESTDITDNKGEPDEANMGHLHAEEAAEVPELLPADPRPAPDDAETGEEQTDEDRAIEGTEADGEAADTETGELPVEETFTAREPMPEEPLPEIEEVPPSTDPVTTPRPRYQSESYVAGEGEATEAVHGLVPEEPLSDLEAADNEQDDQNRIHQILGVLRQRPDYLTSDAQDLIEEGVFHELEVEPSRAEIEEAQWVALDE